MRYSTAGIPAGEPCGPSDRVKTSAEHWPLDRTPPAVHSLTLPAAVTIASPDSGTGSGPIAAAFLTYWYGATITAPVPPESLKVVGCSTTSSPWWGPPMIVWPPDLPVETTAETQASNVPSVSNVGTCPVDAGSSDGPISVGPFDTRPGSA